MSVEGDCLCHQLWMVAHGEYSLIARFPQAQIVQDGLKTMDNPQKFDKFNGVEMHRRG